MQLKDKVAIVTGAARGIGLGIVKRFSSEGARVIAVDIEKESGSSAIKDIENTSFVHCDVGDAAQIRSLVQSALNTHGHIDICVNNAAILRTGDVLDISEQDYEAVLRVNLKGPFLLSQAVARHMVEQQSGSIVNMSSVNGTMTIPNILPYNVSKGGIDQLTRVMAVALADKGVRVNSIGPGSILTEMLEKVMVDDTARRKILSRTPMLRCGTVDEVASVAVFLASDDSSYITGQCIYCDGGRMALNYTVDVPEKI